MEKLSDVPKLRHWGWSQAIALVLLYTHGQASSGLWSFFWWLPSSLPFRYNPDHVTSCASCVFISSALWPAQGIPKQPGGH